MEYFIVRVNKDNYLMHDNMIFHQAGRNVHGYNGFLFIDELYPKCGYRDLGNDAHFMDKVWDDR